MKLQATKWVSCQLLLDEEEMRDLLSALSPFEIYLSGCVTKKGEEKLPHEAFLTTYSRYLSALKEGKPLDDPQFRTTFSAIFTRDSDSLFYLPVEGNQQLVRVKKPVVQLQMHQMDYSGGKFRSMVLGKDTISWGIQFSYPGLYQDPETGEALSTNSLVNTSLFRSLQKWMRQHTLPTPFLVEEKAINVPMRLGKACTTWISCHPHLQRKNIQVRA